MSFSHISPYELTSNPFDLIYNDWMLVSAANESGEQCGRDYNMMTANWGGVGVLWRKPVAFVFIRPQRHTFGFTERCDRMTLSFFDEKYHKALEFCGKYSGRDYDKTAECSLTPVFDKNCGRAVYFSEASLVLVTRKIYVQPLDAQFALSETVTSHYPANDYHKMYICEIEDVLIRD